jgi:16S rRNA (guanine527-N7)-methyltransferase
MCLEHKFKVSDTRLRLLEKYVSLLLTHNRALNLISRKDEENIWTNHILHCTSLLFYRTFPSKGDVLDLGTGGGLPGIIFAILNPGIRFTLLDATRKKIETVKSMVNELHLENVQTVWGRAEEIGRQSGYTGKFDIVVARAVASLDKLVTWAKLFLKPPIPGQKQTEGRIPMRSLVAFKGGDLTNEIEQIRKKEDVKNIDSLIINPQEQKRIVIVYYR